MSPENEPLEMESWSDDQLKAAMRAGQRWTETQQNAFEELLLRAHAAGHFAARADPWTPVFSTQPDYYCTACRKLWCDDTPTCPDCGSPASHHREKLPPINHPK